MSEANAVFQLRESDLNGTSSSSVIDPVDRHLIIATQEGLPLTAQPYHVLAQQLGITAEEVMSRLHTMLDNGTIRRIGVVPNHYRLGYTANGMSVWDIADEHIQSAGREIAALPFVSHCYRRPRHLPHWPYNLFAMLHGKSRAEVEAHKQVLLERLGERQRGHALLYSKRILKKTGLRLRQQER
jgi:DNA-binding Lrp family transcriptional regulator